MDELSGSHLQAFIGGVRHDTGAGADSFQVHPHVSFLAESDGRLD